MVLLNTVNLSSTWLGLVWMNELRASVLITRQVKQFAHRPTQWGEGYMGWDSQGLLRRTVVECCIYRTEFRMAGHRIIVVGSALCGHRM